jgi:hypothetical protein
MRVHLAFLPATASLSAQSTTGTILGTIKDSTGAVIGGAKVALSNEGTGMASETKTDGSGDYVFPNLQAAVYSVQAEAAGFRKARIQRIELALNATVREDIRLEPGVVEQSVTVTAEAPVVNSATSSIAGIVDQHAVQNLPLDGRTLDAIVLLRPFTFGNSARNVLWGPGQMKIDLGLVKDVRFWERYKLNIRVEAFNVPNHPSFGNPSASISTPSTIGRIGGTSVENRAVQMALKLSF